ncbi:MAG: hypothetical protein ACI840_000500 [Ulvibacter sp.]|jgi:hypothetical protein
MKNLLYLGALIFSCSLFAQETHAPSNIITATFIGKTERLDAMPLFNASEYGDKVPTMILDQIFKGGANAPVNKTPTEIYNLQTEPGGIVSLPIEQNFVGSGQNESNFFPPDPTGAVGPSHYVHSVNSLVKIFDKTGTLLVGPVNLSAFLGIPSNNGDPIVLYDQLADRWFVSEFGSLGSNLGLAIGVSETNDPAGAYNVWQFDMNGFPDYPHYGIWHDGYYGTANFIRNGAKSIGFVMERAAMLAGEPSPEMVIFDLPDIVANPLTIESAEPANLLGTDVDTSLPGYITYLQDDAWNAAISFDHLKVWELDVDWVNTGNSTISAPLIIPTDPFDAGEVFGNGSLRQPGTSQRLAGHGGIISFAANYRPFATHNSWLITFNTFIDGNETNGIRWVELRNNAGSPWSIYQEGTYSIADGHGRMMSSSAMDELGNIALAYTTASTNLAVSLRYTGRFDGDPLGMMTVAETTIIDGPGVRTNTNRYGDYSHMTMDPDNFTFWYTGDYFSSNNFWRTRIASWRLFGPVANDTGVVSINSPENGILSNSETVEVSIRNFSAGSLSNIPLELRVDGNLVATETFTGALASNAITTYQFSQTVDLSNAGQTYTIEAKTTLGGDAYEPNNDYTRDVKHLLANDVGIEIIASPQTGSDLGDETVIVSVKNFGASTQSGFNVQYSVDGATPIVEAFTGSIESEEERTFSFSQTADLNVVGTYSFTSSTLLAGDQLPANDEASKVVNNMLCLPESNCSLGHGFRVFEVGGINNVTGCDGDGFGEFTNLIANLAPNSTNSLTVTSDYGNQHMSVWIDFNDDLTFTADEIVVDNYLFAAGQGAGNYTETFDLVVPAGAALGEHRMRARSTGVGSLNNDNACEEILFGETEDYTANIGVLGVNDNAISNSELIVITLPNNQFEVSLVTEFDEGVYMAVFNLLGQQVGFNKNVPQIDGAFRVNLDMSAMNIGVYLIRIGGQSTTTVKTARIIVE